MNIAVVDDLAVGRETLVNYLNEYFSERNINVTISDFSDAKVLSHNLKTTNII